MKFFALALALTALSSHAHAGLPTYRIYEGQVKTLAGESKSISLKVNDEVKDHRFGDPEIQDHGFIKRYLEVTVSEGYQSCSQAIYLEDGSVRLCSGGRLKLNSPESVLSEKQIKGSLLLNGFNQPVGEVSLGLTEVKQDEDRSEDVD